MKELLTMWNGIGMHGQIEGLLGTENSEKKKEIFYQDLVLVGKADFMPPHLPEYVWEFKTSEKTMDKMKPWAEHQVKLYCSMFEKQYGSVFQPVGDADGIYLRHLGTVERDDTWFEEELKKLYEFHLKVEKLWELKQ
jgi:hypothetical protein